MPYLVPLQRGARCPTLSQLFERREKQSKSRVKSGLPIIDQLANKPKSSLYMQFSLC